MRDRGVSVKGLFQNLSVGRVPAEGGCSSEKFVVKERGGSPRAGVATRYRRRLRPTDEGGRGVTTRDGERELASGNPRPAQPAESRRGFETAPTGASARKPAIDRAVARLLQSAFPSRGGFGLRIRPASHSIRISTIDHEEREPCCDPCTLSFSPCLPS